MKTHSRTYNSIVNSLWGILASLITTVLNFFVRVVLVRTLGDEINGIHNLFQSIISIMALMEMGLNTAMIIHLYAPIKDGNKELTRGIIGFYRKLYGLLGISFFVVGVLLAFTILGKMISTSISIGTIRIYFILFVLSFSLGYLTNYRRCILFAEQKNRVSIIATTISEIVFRTIQILTLIVYQNYYIFLVLLILERVCNNSICNSYVIKHHPYLKTLSGSFLPKEKKNAIFSTVKPLFVNQMANTVQMSSRSILISILLGNVSIVGYFGNYQLIMNVIQQIYGQFGGAFTSSFGNLSVDASKEQLKRAYFKSSYVMNWLAAICCSGFICCSDIFIYLVFGENFILDHQSIIILTINLIIYLLNIPIVSVQNALGLHKLDAKYMVIQAGLAVCLGYIFGKIWGMSGIFIGLLLPLVIFTFIRKGVVISKHTMGLTALEYIIYSFKEFGKVLLTVALSYSICRLLIKEYSIGSLVLSVIIAFIVGCLFPLLLSFRQVEFSVVKDIILKRK